MGAGSIPPLSVRVKNMPHYDAIEEEAWRLGWPTRFTDDLYVHDLHACDLHDPSEPFVWAIHAGGTHLYFASKGRTFHQTPGAIMRAFGDLEDGVRFYTWDGRALTAHASAEACAEAAREFGERWRWEQEERRAS